MWAALAGAPGALGYRAVNTLDSMVGHRNDRYRRYGWASARLDDVADFVPARLTAVLVGRPPEGRGARLARGPTQAPAHPSPNAGVAEAAFAAALGSGSAGRIVTRAGRAARPRSARATARAGRHRPGGAAVTRRAVASP